jgi:threonine synthase
MSHVAALVCPECGREFVPGDVGDTRPADPTHATDSGHGSDSTHTDCEGALDVRYDYDALADRFELPEQVTDLWDFRPLLPVDDGPVVSLGAGGTRLLDAPTLSERLGVTVRVKDETGNPTGSSKDRGTAVPVTRAKQGGHDVVSCASTGNAAASLAGYAARAGLDCRIFVPRSVPEAKAVQPRLYGADVLAVDGAYDDAYERCRRVCVERGWDNLSAGVAPYAIEGKRTLGFEIAMQAPDADWVVVPMGNGGSLAATWKGLAGFERLGFLEDAPRMLGVQAAGVRAIYEQFTGDGRERPDSTGSAGTAADSIDVRVPHSADRACRALGASGGDAVVVEDEAILRAQRLLGETEGLFVEPASAAAVAGVERARSTGLIGADELVVVVATGSGLKDAESAASALDDSGSLSTGSGATPEE